MSSKFKSMSAGIQKKPQVCISKLKEQQRVIRPRNTQLALSFTASGDSATGPWAISDSVYLVRPVDFPLWRTPARVWQGSAGYEIVVYPNEPAPLYGVRLVTYVRPENPLVAGEFYGATPGYEDDAAYQLTIRSWQRKTPDDNAYCRLWIS